MMREQMLEQERIDAQNSEHKVKQISLKFKEQIQKKENERIQELEATKDQRKGQRQQEREEKRRKYEELVKRNEERIKEKQQKLQDIADEMRLKAKDDREATKDQRDKLKEEHQEFLEKQKDKLQKEMEAMVKEREELKRVQQELEKKQSETINNLKGQVVQYFEGNKDKLKAEKKEKEDIKKFIEKPVVKAVFDKFDVPLRYFFDFYSKSEHHGISFELDQNMETMNQKEFVRFAYQSNIVPTLLPIDEINRQFKLLVRDQQDKRSDVRLRYYT